MYVALVCRLLIIALSTFLVFSSTMFSNIGKSHRLDGFAITSRHVKSLMHCVFLCTNEYKSACKSINIGKLGANKYTCQMNSVAVGPCRVGQLVPSPGLDYWEPLDVRVAGLSAPYALHFHRRDTRDYVTINGAPDMTAITTCLWAKTSSTSSDEGNFLTYSLPTQSNEYGVFLKTSKLSVMTRSSWQLSTKTFLLSDGQWHSLCFTWSSVGGVSEIFTDGKQFSKITGTAAGHTISGGGLWVVGQEQDSFGAGFESNQMYVGELSNINVWDRVLTSDEIAQYSSSCASNMQGNVKKWEDFKSGLKGDVLLLEKASCFERVDGC